MRPPKGRLARSRRQKPRSPLPVDYIRLASVPSSAPTRARMRFAGHFRTIPPHDPRSLTERSVAKLELLAIFGRFHRTTSSNRRQTARRSRRKKGRAPTKKEGRTIRPRPTQAQKDCDTPSRSAAAWDDQTPSHPNTEGPGSYSLPPLSASFAASPSTSPKPSLKLLGTTTVPPVSRTLSYSRCMARKRSAASFLA